MIRKKKKTPHKAGTKSSSGRPPKSTPASGPPKPKPKSKRPTSSSARPVMRGFEGHNQSGYEEKENHLR